jgi:hypothetical protein
MDLTGLTVVATYKNDSTRQFTVGAENVSGYNKHRVGQQTIQVKMGNGIAAFTVTVKPLIGISLSRPPAKLLYKQGESLNLSGLTVLGNWEDIGSDRVEIAAGDVSGYNPGLAGTQHITLFFEGQSVSFPVTVVPLSSIAITRPPARLSYRQGENIDLTGLVVTGTWEGIGSQQILVTPQNISGYNANNIGRQAVRITIYNATATFTVMVKALSAIEITSPPAKTWYDYGETLDLTGLVVTGVFSDLSREPIAVNASNISYFNNTKAGDQVLVVTVDGRTTFFIVQVRVLVSITVQQMPYKVVYQPGEELNLNGLIVVGTYSDNSTRIIPPGRLTVSGFNSSIAAGQQAVIVTVEGRQAVFAVTVSPLIRQ